MLDNLDDDQRRIRELEEALKEARRWIDDADWRLDKRQILKQIDAALAV